MSCSGPLTGRGKRTTMTKRSCWYILPIVRGGGFRSGVVLNFMRCPQQSTSSLGSRSNNSMGLRGLFGVINPFDRVSTLIVSTMSMERRSVERNVESTVATTPCLNLDWIASWTMMRLRQVLIPFPVVPWLESILQHAAESTFMLTPDEIRGRLVETPCGHGVASDFVLELTNPLLAEDGDRILLMLVPNRMESLQWEEGSHKDKGS